jgi:UDP-glucose 4-epimerase
MKILVIGGAGYIGCHVVDVLCDLGHDVVVFDNLSSGFKENVNEKANLVVGSILNLIDLENVFNKKFDVVFHFAALKNAGESMVYLNRYAETNIIGTLNILNIMVKYNVKSIIFSSSAAVYGTPKYFPMDESHPTRPENFYGFTKLEIERFLEWYSKIYKINFAALRYFNAAGYTPGKCKEKNPGNLLPIVMEVASGQREEVQIYGNDYNTIDGTGVRDYIHVLDLADAHIKAMTYVLHKNKNIIINLSTQKGYSVLEIINKAKIITRKDIKYTIISRRAGDTATVIASSQLANSLLKWKPQYSDIDTILKSMWEVYRK